MIAALHFVTGHLRLLSRFTVLRRTEGMSGRMDVVGTKSGWCTSPKSFLPPSPLRTDEGLNLWCYLISPII